MHERPIGDLVDALRARGRAASTTSASPAFRRCRSRRRRSRSARTVRVRGDVSSQFLSALLMALPLTGRARARRDRGRAHLEAVRRDHARHDAALRRRGRAATAGRASTCPRARATSRRARSTSKATRPRPRISSPRARLRRRAGAGGRRRAREHPGRRALRRGARAHGREGRDGRELDRGARRRPPLQGASTLDLNHIPDAAMTAAVAGALRRRRTEHAAQHRQLARQGDRPHRRDGDRAAQARRDASRRARTTCGSRRRGSQAPRLDAWRRVDRHLRRPPHGDVLLAGALGRRPVRINDPGCVAKTFPDYFDVLATIVS